MLNNQILTRLLPPEKTSNLLNDNWHKQVLKTILEKQTRSSEMK